MHDQKKFKPSGPYEFYAEIGRLTVSYHRTVPATEAGLPILIEREDCGLETSVACAWVPSCKVVSSIGFSEAEVRALERFLRENAALIVELAVAGSSCEPAIERTCHLCGSPLVEVAEDEVVRFRGRDLFLSGVRRLRCSDSACAREDSYTAEQMQEIEDRLVLVTMCGPQGQSGEGPAELGISPDDQRVKIPEDVDGWMLWDDDDFDPDESDLYAPVSFEQGDPRVKVPARDGDGAMVWDDPDPDEGGAIYDALGREDLDACFDAGGNVSEMFDQAATAAGEKLDDAGLCELLGTTLKEVEADVERNERGDFSGIAFSEPVEGLKRACGEAVVEETTAMCKLDNGCVLMDDGVEARAKEWEDGSREGSLANVRFGRHQLADGPLIGRRYSRSREVSMEELCAGWDGVKVGEEWGGPDVGAEIC